MHPETNQKIPTKNCQAKKTFYFPTEMSSTHLGVGGFRKNDNNK
jgi:hypothetical protein